MAERFLAPKAISAGQHQSNMVGTDSCAYRLKRSLTLDPTGLPSSEAHVQLLPAFCSCGQVAQASQTTDAGPCLLCLGTRRSGSGSPPPTPFVSAAAVSQDVVSAFQTVHEPLCSPGSVFRNQDTIIETSSSGDACASTPTPQVPRLSGSLSTPVQGGVCSGDNVIAQQPTFQRQSSACLGATGSCPAHGVKAVCGKRNKMEDMYAVQPNFFDIPLSPTADDLRNKLPVRIALQLGHADQFPTCGAGLSPSDPQGVAKQSLGRAGDQPAGTFGAGADAMGTSDTLHFFGVYDGHGGCQAAEHCARRLHHHLSRSLATVCGCLVADGNQLLQAPEPDSSQVDWSLSSSLMQSMTKLACMSLGGPETASPPQHEKPPQREKPRCLMGKGSVDSDSSSSTPDDHVLEPSPENDTSFDNDSSGSSGSDPADAVSVSGLLEQALKQAFVNTDAEFGDDGCAAMVGSTALVALVGTRKVWLANCGDSRAVLCRNGRAIQLTDDHKPEREDEAERVEKAGGQVLFYNGHRVMGVLAMSRAIGDHGLRPYIIPEPEVSVVCRQDDDDFLLLASDGLWDVMANQEATNLCIRCIKRAREKGASRNAAVRIAASVLTKAAIDRGSKDNVTVLIIDLRSERPGAAPGPQATCGDAARGEEAAAPAECACTGN
ncbi:hypothetical protein Agub_g1119 [Astrephomene gubernaculifera]|uniref:protein-serine/threonine phosphatase n=1 Tax=Astrephomene gubernaculifera TaxID=47775 RepID=A0AAD3DIE0_9CHLO|nr:hypothetical protein Agub_g1119 [Astrephomene gubernaculifera]